MATVRQVHDSDIEAVGRLSQAAGWAPPTVESWHHLWRANPALAEAPEAPRGWVLTDGDDVVGFLANIVQLYELNGRRIRAACAASMVVDPRQRGSSLQLYMAFVRQSAVDLLLNTTAAPEVSKISEFLKFRRIPQPAYNRSSYWILRPLAFARSALRKKGLPPWLAALGGPALGTALAIEAAIRGRGPRYGADLETRVVPADGIGSEFDELWRRTREDPASLLAVRDAATLRWHFAARERPNPPFLVTATRDGTLAGYAAVVRQDADHLGLTRARLADLVVEGPDDSVVRALLHAACGEAGRRGASMMEVVGFPASTRTTFGGFAPFELRDEGWPFLYRAIDRSLDEPLSREETWRACLYDGDGSL
jgi:hypothetical protein